MFNAMSFNGLAESRQWPPHFWSPRPHDYAMRSNRERLTGTVSRLASVAVRSLLQVVKPAAAAAAAALPRSRQTFRLPDRNSGLLGTFSAGQSPPPWP